MIENYEAALSDCIRWNSPLANCSGPHMMTTDKGIECEGHANGGRY